MPIVGIVTLNKFDIDCDGNIETILYEPIDIAQPIQLVAFCNTGNKKPSVIYRDKNRDGRWDSKKLDKNCDGNFEEEELL